MHGSVSGSRITKLSGEVTLVRVCCFRYRCVNNEKRSRKTSLSGGSMNLKASQTQKYCPVISKTMREDFTPLESCLGSIHLIFGLSVDIELAKVEAGSTTLRDNPLCF